MHLEELLGRVPVERDCNCCITCVPCWFRVQENCLVSKALFLKKDIEEVGCVQVPLCSCLFLCILNDNFAMWTFFLFGSVIYFSNFTVNVGTYSHTFQRYRPFKGIFEKFSLKSKKYIIQFLHVLTNPKVFICAKQ